LNAVEVQSENRVDQPSISPILRVSNLSPVAFFAINVTITQERFSTGSTSFKVSGIKW
jgi:hypothetical protein